MNEKLITPKKEENKKIISSAHGKGSLREGHENYGQTQTKTIYSAGESGLNPGSKVIKTEFQNNQSEKRQRITEYLKSARKVTRYEDKVVVEMPDGTIREFHRKNPKTESQIPESQIEGSEQSQIQITEPQKTEKDEASKEKEKIKNRARILIETLTKNPSTSGREVSPLSYEEQSQIWIGRDRTNFTPEQYLHLIERIREIPAKISELQAEVDKLFSEDPQDIEFENEIRYAISLLQKESIELNKKFLKSGRDRQRIETIKSDIQKLLAENETHFQDKFKRVDERRDRAFSLMAQIRELEKGLSRSDENIQILTKEYLKLLADEMVRTSPENANISTALEKVRLKGDNEDDRDKEYKTYESDLRMIIRRKYLRELDGMTSEVLEELTSENPSLAGVEIPKAQSLFNYPSQSEYSSVSEFYSNPEFISALGNSEIVSQSYNEARDTLIRRSMREISNDFTGKSIETTSLRDNFKDPVAARYLFARFSSMENAYDLRDYLESLSEDDIKKLKEFYGEQEVDLIIASFNKWRLGDFSNITEFEKVLKSARSKFKESKTQ